MAGEHALPWWELVVRAAAIYAALLVLFRISGKRTVGQFTAFDLLVVMLLSEGVSNALSGGDNSLGAGIIIAITLVGLNMVLAYATTHSQRLQVWVEGRPVLIGRDGQVFEDVLRAQRVPMADFEQALREADCILQDVRCAFLEADGKISILQNKSEKIG